MLRIACALAALVLCGALARGATLDVYVYSFEFNVNPPGGPVLDAVVTAGDSVRWVWVEGNHTTTSVAASPEQWDANISSGSPTFTRVFSTPGTFHYYCKPHGFDNGDGTAGGMAGTVTVLPPGSGACCLPVGGCVQTSPADCMLQGGTYQGNGVACTPNPCPNQPVTTTLVAAADTILYEDPAGSSANGAGRYLHIGNLADGRRRRIVVRFDVSAIPSTALIQNATLRLWCNQASGSAVDASVHRATSASGEGTSDDNGAEDDGTAATVNDATWLHRFYNSVFWTTPGGDFVPTPSAVVSVPATSGVFVSWDSAGLAADVQAWVEGSAPNGGWVVRGDEASSTRGRRFDSRQGPTSANHPALTLTYLPEAPTGACCFADGTCSELSASLCAAGGGTYHGDGSMCESTNCPIELEPFVDALPLPGVASPTSGTPGGSAHYDIAAQEVQQRLHRDLPLTRVWGYAGSYPGPTIEARRGQPVTVRWINDLRVFETGLLRTAHALAVDTCMHGPDMTGSVPVIVTHLHGGHVASDSDGYPELSFAPGQQSPLYTYPNDQPAAALWYHDHALGITRLNVYMGLAGYYLLRDDAEDALDLPRGEYEIPLAIQDRSVNPDGSLRYPETWHDHFFGDFVLVNGKIWPRLDVKQGKYRFRVLNGSTSRSYTLALSNGATFWQIGSDTGLLSAPVPLMSLTLTPGERADLVMDFAPYAPGTGIILTNSAPAPFPGAPGAGVIPNVMKFIVVGQAGDTDPLPSELVTVEAIPEGDAARQRNFDLRQEADTHCPGHEGGVWLINSLGWDDVTEFPKLGTTEVWAWRNRSPVTHPMHMHLVAFQVLDRQPFDVVSGLPTGPRVPPGANETGWKDTVQAPPGEITRVIARFETFAGLFPYHCHILEHEDHEMMRQFQVRPICIGDADDDSDVEFADVTSVLTNFGVVYAPAIRIGPGDADHDGTVSFADITAVLVNYGANCP